MLDPSKNAKLIIEKARIACVSVDPVAHRLLHNAGFRAIEHLRDRIHLIDDVVGRDQCDLLLLDDNIEGYSAAQVVESVRKGLLGKNPFLPIIALVNDPRPGVVTQYVNSGADDVIVKPLSSGFISARMIRLVERQVEYVVTHDYLGPNRRSAKRTDRVRDGLIIVPNTLNLSVDAEQRQETIKVKFDEIDARRLSVQGQYITNLINAALMSPSTMLSSLQKIKIVIEEFTARSYDRDHQASKVCDVLAFLIDNTTCPTQTKNIELLLLLSEVLGALFQSDNTEDDETVTHIIHLIRQEFSHLS